MSVNDIKGIVSGLCNYLGNTKCIFTSDPVSNQFEMRQKKEPI